MTSMSSINDASLTTVWMRVGRASGPAWTLVQASGSLTLWGKTIADVLEIGCRKGGKRGRSERFAPGARLLAAHALLIVLLVLGVRLATARVLLLFLFRRSRLIREAHWRTHTQCQECCQYDKVCKTGHIEPPCVGKDGCQPVTSIRLK